MSNYNTSVMSREDIDFSKEPLFFGSGRNIARLDMNIEQVIQKKADEALGLIWFKSDFSYKKDGEDYAGFEKDRATLFLKNLKFQTMADSLAGRSVIEVFGPIVTNPQLEVWFSQHSFFETVIHSPTYAEIVKALPVDAVKEFDDIIINESIMKRASFIATQFDETIRLNAMRILKTDDYSEYEHKKSLVLSLYALNILEAVLFKSSFITTFAFNENGVMESSAKAVKKIQLDEITHYQMSTLLLKRHIDLPEYAPIFAEIQEQVKAMYLEARAADFEWIDYSYPTDSNPNLLGVNGPVLKQFVDYNLKVVSRQVGINLGIENVANPCVWADKYSKLSSTQAAMKETDNSAYLLGKLDVHVSNEDYNEFLL